MNAPVGSAGFVVEVQLRYRDCLSGRWPVAVAPQPEELLSSWLCRLAFGNGLPAQAFAASLDLRPGVSARRIDLDAPDRLRELLAHRAGVSPAAIDAMTLDPAAGGRLTLPARAEIPPGRRGRTRAAWLQFCPSCLADDQAPYFRKDWRLATTIVCARHGRRLLDRCTVCAQGLAPLDQSALAPLAICATCGFDLRQAKAPRLRADARRAAMKLATLGRAASLAGVPRVDALLALSRQTGDQKSIVLTALSTASRADCLPNWAPAIDRMSALHGGDRPRREGRRPGGKPAPGLSLGDLLRAYADVQKRRRQSASCGSAAPGDSGLRSRMPDASIVSRSGRSRTDPSSNNDGNFAALT